VVPLEIDGPSAWPPIEDRSGRGLEPIKAVFLVIAPFTQNSAPHHGVLQVV
jgi:hypothetical protein